MNSIAITNSGQQLTMSSREIAELTGKEHRHVMRDIRVMKDQLGDLFVGTDQNWTHPQNGMIYPEIVLDKDTTMCLIAGYDAVVRMRIIKRWTDLENEKKFQVPKTLSGALRLAAEQAEVIENQDARLAVAEPKAKFVDSYMQAKTGSMGIREVCKVLRAKEPEFVDFLLQRGFMYRTTPDSPLMPKADHIHNGRFEAKTGVNRANSHAFVHYKFTSKGVQWIAGEWGTHNVRGLF